MNAPEIQQAEDACCMGCLWSKPTAEGLLLCRMNAPPVGMGYPSVEADARCGEFVAMRPLPWQQR